jgi:hypothetical protein
MCEYNSKMYPFPASVPISWTCDPSYYNAQDGCDCGCGILDPDCISDNITVSAVTYGCASSEICSNGTCVTDYVPPEWICSKDYFGSDDGCDCNCGAPDPDCHDSTTEVFNCPCSNMTCQNGFCTGLCGSYNVQLNAANSVDGKLIALIVLAILTAATILMLVIIVPIFTAKIVMEKSKTVITKFVNDIELMDIAKKSEE